MGFDNIIGLSELGQRENPDEGVYYDDCYAEDRDNYIDIILVGDEAAARNITFVEIPAVKNGMECSQVGSQHISDLRLALQGDNVPGKGDQVAPVAFVGEEGEGRGEIGVGKGALQRS
jgi:hypothetical protein